MSRRDEIIEKVMDEIASDLPGYISGSDEWPSHIGKVWDAAIEEVRKIIADNEIFSGAHNIKVVSSSLLSEAIDKLQGKK